MDQYHNKNLVILELGIGPYNQMIKEPLMQITQVEPNASYFTFNKGEIFIKPEIANKSIGIDGDLSQLIPEILKIKDNLKLNNIK